MPTVFQCLPATALNLGEEGITPDDLLNVAHLALGHATANGITS